MSSALRTPRAGARSPVLFYKLFFGSGFVCGCGCGVGGVLGKKERLRRGAMGGSKRGAVQYIYLYT